MNVLNKPLDGLLRISRISSNKEDDFVRIEIVDDISGTVVIHADVSLPEFAKTLFGSERLNTKFTLRSSNVGRKSENKTEMVKMPLGSYTEKRADKALAKFEVDGCLARERVCASLR